ncbi:hypothetical protein MESS4_830103 [Mesorhizobium sp. STM 4661]|nr:hypothetical protein MESS4_830103 [Mesorhizobium sp. STM 4661]
MCCRRCCEGSCFLLEGEKTNCRDPSRPPRSCRTSPPQVGRLAVIADFANYKRWKVRAVCETANLPQLGEMSGRTEGARRNARLAQCRQLRRQWQT